MRGSQIYSVLTLEAHTSRFDHSLVPFKASNVSGFGVQRRFRNRGGRNKPALILWN